MSITEEHVKLTNAIVSGKYNLDTVRREIDRIENEYGKSAFNSFVVEKKPAPWTKEDLDKLEIQSASGAGSKDFYLYMAEVSDYLHRTEKARESKRKEFVKKRWLLIVVGIAIVSIVVWLITAHKANAEVQINENQIPENQLSESTESGA